MTESPPTQPSLLVRLRDADAADLMQNVLRVIVSAIKRLDYDPRRGSFRGWLFTIVRSQLLNFRRRKHDFCRGAGDSGTRAFLEQQPAPEQETAEWDAEYDRRLFAWAVQ